MEFENRLVESLDDRDRHELDRLLSRLMDRARQL
jgi:hypothetical protein